MILVTLVWGNQYWGKYDTKKELSKILGLTPVTAGSELGEMAYTLDTPNWKWYPKK